MDKMKMESVDMTAQNVEKIGALFPNCITETVDENGKPKNDRSFSCNSGRDTIAASVQRNYQKSREKLKHAGKRICIYFNESQFSGGLG